MLSTNQDKEVSENFENLLRKAPEKVTHNALWNITVLLENTLEARKAFLKVAKNPNDYEIYTTYFTRTFGMLRLYDLLIESSDISSESKSILTKLRKAYNQLDKLASPILDNKKQDKECEKMISTLLGAISQELERVWLDTVHQYGVVEQLKSFSDRDMTQYVKHITGYTPGNFSDVKEDTVKFFIKLTFEKFIENA